MSIKRKSMTDCFEFKFFGYLLVFLLVSGCSAGFSKTGNYIAQPREENCDFSIYTAQPKSDYEEIGEISFPGNFLEGSGGGPSSAESAKNSAREAVCKAGGNALLLWQANGAGNYKKGTVVYMQ